MDEQNHATCYGLADPSAYFDQKNDEGNVAVALKRSRDRQAKNIAERKEKTYKAIAASNLIGRSRGWLRENDPDAPKDEHGHGYWTLERINELRHKAGTFQGRPEGAEPIVLALSKLKGGVGNTTTCVHLAHYLALQGLRVLAIDFDAQASLTSILGGMNPDIHLDEDDIIVHPLQHEPGAFHEVIRETYFHNVFLAPANGLLRNLEVELTLQAFGYKPSPKDENGNEIGAYERLSHGLKEYKDYFDVILIDCPPNLNLITGNALNAADGMINVLRPSGPDSASHAMYMGSLANYYSYEGKPLRYFRLLISQYQDNGACNEEDLLLRQLHGPYVLHNKIAVNAEISRAMGNLHSVYSLEKPLSTREAHNNGKKTMDKALGEILGDIRAIWEMETEEDG